MTANATKMVTLPEIAEKFTDGPFGSNLKSSHYVDSGVRVLRLQDIGIDELINTDPAFISREHYDDLSRNHCKPGDVIIGTMGEPNLRACVIPDDLTDSLNKADCMLLRVNRLVADPTYISKALNSGIIAHQAQTLVRGQTRGRISLGRLKSLEIPLPPLAEQKRIAGILDAADALRAKRREALAQLDILLQATFLDLFGDPVTNPKGWKGCCFDDLLTLVQYGPRFFNEAYTPTGIRIVRITDLDFQGNLDFEAMPKLEVSAGDVESYALRPGDLILARTGATVGKTALIRHGDPESIAGAYFIRMRFKSEVTPLYVQWVMKSRGVQAIIWQKSQQSAQPNFNGPAIRKLPLPVPPIEVQNRFNSIVSSIEKQQVRMRAQLQELDTLFASLQTRAFRGEL